MPIRIIVTATYPQPLQLAVDLDWVIAKFQIARQDHWPAAVRAGSVLKPERPADGAITIPDSP
ncbi:MAG: hypothetical protein HQ497_05585 [SAR86 cluster bacterium]|uniref:Uncharacterized protein n=1 Tax=SAR86 cluster bacterium TaxID=2030880 RepID=A0A972VWI6_9GAMM|nr:hypothetical protein [SAR86 cluster bacterium]